MASSEPSLRRRLFTAAKIAIVLVVLLAVGHSFRDALGQLGERSWEVEPAWLVLAGFLYLLGFVPMTLFWWGLLYVLSHQPTFVDVLRAYFLGHLAKYVPGKALTLVVRTSAVRGDKSAATPIVATVFLEVLTLMAIGACLSALLLGRVLPERAAYPLLAGIFALAAVLPTIPPVTMRILHLALRLRRPPEEERPGATGVNYSWQLYAAGWVASCFSWILSGLSIWATVRAVGVPAAPLTQLDLWIVAAAMPVAAGFLSMIPGGFVVRDGLMFQILSPSLGEPTALVVTALVRLNWLVAECIGCGILEIVFRTRRTEIGSDKPPTP